MQTSSFPGKKPRRLVSADWNGLVERNRDVSFFGLSAERIRAGRPEQSRVCPRRLRGGGGFSCRGLSRQVCQAPLFRCLLLVACLLVTAGPVWGQTVRAWAGDDEPVAAAAAAAPEPPAAARPGAAGRIGGTGDPAAVLFGGGLLMIPLLACSFALVVFGIERTVSLRTSQVVPPVFVERFIGRLQTGEFDRSEAAAACAEHPSPVARAFAAAVRRWGRPAVEVEQAVIDACERELNYLRKYRRVFNGVATISPLFGLLGTVLGLIRSFNDIAAAGAIGQPDLLARGFGEALITTAMGLVVAIPALVLHSYFTSRVDRLAMQLDESCQPVIEAVAATSPELASRRKAG